MQREDRKKREGQKILLVEDDWELGEGITWMLEKEGFLPFTAHSIGEARKLFEERGAELVLLDVNLPDGEGFDFCRHLGELWTAERVLCVQGLL